MPVTLKLSDDEARDLAEMLSTAATVAASNQQDGAEGRLVAWGKLVSRLMEGLSLQVRDTVEGETPAAAATSLMVTAIVCSSCMICLYCKAARTQCQCLHNGLRKLRKVHPTRSRQFSQRNQQLVV